jgi:hypothetical protein
MADAVQVYIDTVRDYQGDGELLVEQSLPIAHITGEEAPKARATPSSCAATRSS